MTASVVIEDLYAQVLNAAGVTSAELQCRLAYTPGVDPYAVSIVFNLRSSEPTTWVVSRDLLLLGVSAEAGDRAAGDVVVRPRGMAYELEFRTGAGALVQLPYEDVSRFLFRVFALVPPGTESDHVDLDAELALFQSELG